MMDLVFCRRFIVAVILIGMVAACGGKPSENWPKSVSQFDGWNGFKLIKGDRCPVCYTLDIPKNFGLNNTKELRILTELSRRRVSMKYNLDGPLFDDEDVLDHLLRIALEHDYVPAGSIILNPDKYDMLLGLETSERIVGTHVIPLLNGFKDLTLLADGKEFKFIARYVCHWSAGQKDFRRTDNLIDKLKKENPRLSGYFLSACSIEKQFMKKHGEKFIGKHT